MLPIPLSAVGYHIWKAAAKYSWESASISEMVRGVESMAKIDIAPSIRNRYLCPEHLAIISKQFLNHYPEG
jgi:hypothetical protein